MTVRIGNIAFDCEDVLKVAAFWSAVDELIGLGATVVGAHRLDGQDHSWTVMDDPEGNEFCIATKSFTGWKEQHS